MERALQFGIECTSYREVSKGDAVMFDIDDTLIRSGGSPIPEMITLFHLCQTFGYTTVIITARPHTVENVKYTKRQLLLNGITENILMFSKAENKTETKKNLKLNFILSVGDQHTDLGGSDHYIKLPDEFDNNIYLK